MNIFVLGVGRSGTSMVMQILEELGVKVRKKGQKKDQFNPHGYYEDEKLDRLVTQILQGKVRVTEKEIAKYFGDGNFAAKYPNMALCLDRFTRQFQKHNTKFIVIVRHPKDVIDSYWRRNYFGPSKTMYMYSIFMYEIWKFLSSGKHDFIVVDYEMGYEEIRKRLKLWIN